MKAILINPFNQTITEVEYSGNFKEIYKLIDCSTFDCINIDDDNTLFVDDEGLLKENRYAIPNDDDDLNNALQFTEDLRELYLKENEDD